MVSTQTLLLAAFCSVVLPSVVDACFALGGCGFGGCMAGCGRYCSAKAKGAKTLSASKTLLRENPNDVEGFPDAQPRANLGPDGLFKQCCEESGVPASCMDKCSYSSYSSVTLRSMFLRIDTCPLQAVTAIHFCASRGKDHTPCCAARGVASTSAGNKCLLFCEQPRANSTQLDFTYMPCYDTFEEIKICFWHDALKATGTNLEDAFVAAKQSEEWI